LTRSNPVKYPPKRASGECRDPTNDHVAKDPVVRHLGPTISAVADSAALLLLILPLVAVGMAIAGRIDRFWIALRVVLAAYTMVCALRGLRIDIHKEDTTLEIYLP